MISGCTNPNMPPLMSEESKDPSPWNLFKAKIGDGMNAYGSMMNDPKSRMAQAMMIGQMTKAGQSFASPRLMKPVKPREPVYELYGGY